MAKRTSVSTPGTGGNELALPQDGQQRSLREGGGSTRFRPPPLFKDYKVGQGSRRGLPCLRGLLRFQDAFQDGPMDAIIEGSSRPHSRHAHMQPQPAPADSSPKSLPSGDDYQSVKAAMRQLRQAMNNPREYIRNAQL